MDSKQQHVQRWIEKVFAGSSIPDYEINTSTIDTLFDMAQRSEEVEHQNSIMLSAIERQTKEYESETQRLRAVHATVGVALKDLSPQSKQFVDTLTTAALTAKLGDCSLASLSLAISSLDVEEAALAEGLEQRRLQLTCLEEDIHKLAVQHAELTKMNQELAAERKKNSKPLAKLKQDSHFLKKKIDQYHVSITSLAEQMKKAGYSDILRHSELKKLSEEVSQLEEELGPLKVELSHYSDLPPDVQLAKVKIEEAKAELEELERQLSTNIDLLEAEK